MQMEHPVCGGIDVHKDTLTACLRRVDANGHVSKEGRECATTYPSLLALSDWLVEQHCPIVAMASTGVYWKPVYHVLVGTVEVYIGGSRSFGAKNNDLVQIFVFIIPPPIRISYEEGDPYSFVKPSRTSLSGGTQRPQALAFQGLINGKSILAIGVDVFESCWREIRQILLLYAVTLSP